MTLPDRDGGSGAEALLAAFRERHGRPLRVLHIGNIANNAYNNAKIQRAAGIEADVLCYAYYHIMGCPEWEDADFDGDVGDPFFPDWWAVELNGFRRPEWFVQGRLALCLEYLLARTEGDRQEVGRLWRRLQLERWLKVRTSRRARFVRGVVATATLAPPAAPPEPPATPATGPGTALGDVRTAASRGTGALRRTTTRIVVYRVRLGAYQMRRAGWMFRHRVLARAKLGAWHVRHRGRYYVLLSASYASSSTRTLRRKTVAVGRAGVMVARGGSPREAAISVLPRRLSRLARTERELALVAEAFAAAAVRHEPVRTTEAAVLTVLLEDALGPDTVVDIEELHRPVETDPARAAHAHGDQAVAVGDGATARAEGDGPTVVHLDPEHPLESAWRALFPEREPLRFDDYASYTGDPARWTALLAHYDIVQGYSTDPIIPIVHGAPHFTAYEHGTLREIPFEDSPRGRVCALAYRLAPAVFVTNLDVLPSVERLGIEPSRVVRLPHAVDSGKLLRYARENGGWRPPPGVPRLFSPTRQDWVSEDPSMSKGNDRLLHAAAEVVREGAELRLVLTAWGRDLDASKELIESLGLGPYVEWVAPMKKRELWARYLTSHAVIDQFLTPAISGVAFESLAFGLRVITALDVPTAADFFDVAPPLLVASTPPEIATALRAVVADPLDHAGIGAASQAWFVRHHSAERILDLQVTAYDAVLRSLDEKAHPGP